MSIFRRMFKIGAAEAHSAIDKLEDPIKLTEQGIRDLKVDLDKSLQGLAEVKALAIRARREESEYQRKSQDYERKAMQLLQSAQDGRLAEAEADRLAGEALARKEENDNLMKQATQQREQFDQNAAQLDRSVQKLRSQINHYENELKTLKARARVSSATKKINKSMANIDSHGTVAMLERMKEKVTQEEALSEAYGDIAGQSRSLDDEIDGALAGSEQRKSSDALAVLKARMANGQ
ncbi:MAG: PspA/IM30 family protein [Catalinimonas sp.]